MGDPITPAASGTEARVTVVRDAETGQRRFVIEDAVVIEGRLHKPTAFYILQRSTLDYQWNQLQEGFLDRIVEAGKGPEF